MTTRPATAPLIALLLATPALADLPEAPPADEIIVTAQRANQTQVIRAGQLGALGQQDAADVPFTIRGYGEALILNQQPLTLGQVLENDPSVRTTYAFGNAAELFVIRGFPLFSDDIGLDGLYGITPRQLVAPELYERVEVLNGASAFLNGAAPGGSGIGGNVNLVPKRADRDLARATVGAVGDAHAGGAVDVARRFADGRLGVRVNAAVRGGEVAIDGERRAAEVAGLSLDWRGERLRLFLDAAYQRVGVRGLRPKVTLATTTIPAVPAADANYGQRWSYSSLRDVFGAARLEYDLSEAATLYAGAGARDGAERGVYDGITVNDALTGAATGSALFVLRTDDNAAAQAGIRVKLAGAVSHQFNAGASAAWQVNRNAFDFLGGFGGFPTNLYATPAAPLPPTGFVGGDLSDPYAIQRTRLFSVFASDTLGFAADRVLLTGGVRLQRIRTRTYGYYDGGALATTYDEDAVTPVAGLVVKPADGLSLFANRIEGLAQGPTAPLDPTIVNPGEAFPPVRSVQYEAGAKVAARGLNLSVAAFRIDQPAAFAAPVGAGAFRFGLNGVQRNQGVELSVDGEPAPGLRVIAGASYTDAKLRRTAAGAFDGNRAPGVPDWLLNANVEWDVAATGLTLTGRAVHTGGQAVDQANTLALPAWTRVDLGARYVLALAERPVTLRAGVDNVANKRYWASAFGTFGTALLQGAPRTWRASASLEF